MMKKCLFILLGSLSLSLSAIGQTIVDSMQYVTVHQDARVAHLLQIKAKGGQLAEKEVDGFRVQVFSSNSQQTAKNEAMMMEKMLMDKVEEPIYVIYANPFWKVRLGNFRSYEAAQEYKSQLLTAIPELVAETYVVRDMILVLE